jgi:hypothetical protein
MNDRDMSRKMRELESELRGLEPAQELVILDMRLALEADAAFAVQMKITKARLLDEVGKPGEAIRLLEDCSRSAHADESVTYSAAEILVQSHRYREAEGFLEEAEGRIAQTGRVYYRSCIYLLHAYCSAKLGEFARSGRLLEMVEDRDEQLFWLRTRPVISVESVEALIEAGLRGEGKP